MNKLNIRRVAKHNVQREETFKQEFGKGKEPENQAEGRNKLGVIFVNPSKINSFKQTDCSKTVHHLNPYNTPNTKLNQPVEKTKIYLNPNFKNSVLPSFQHGCNRRKETPTNVDIRTTVVKSGISNFHKQITKLTCEKNEESNHTISNEPAESRFVKKTQKIYINQHFTKPVREVTNTSQTVYRRLSDDSTGIGTSRKNVPPSSCSTGNCSTGVGVSTEMKSSNEKLSSDSLKEPLPHKKDSKVKEYLSFDNTKTHQTSKAMLDQKIFINPTFRRRLSGSKTIYGNLVRNDLTVSNSHTLPDNSLVNSRLNTLISDSLMKSNQESASSNSNATPSPLGQSVNLKNTKTTGQRSRTRSTCLVSVSATKIVRRRKTNLKLEPVIESSLNKLLFLSKTKLVRNALLKNSTDDVSFVKNKFVKRDLNLKSNLKSLLTQNYLQHSTPDKLTKSRQNSVSSDLNKVDIVPKSRCVTKIKSYDGKSLRSILSDGRSSESTKRCTVQSLTNQPLFLSKTKLVRQAIPVLGKDMSSGKATVNHVGTELQFKPKPVLSRSLLHYLTIHKINNLKKESALGSANLLNKASKSGFVTKMRYNNGKSLKLVQNNEIPQKYLKASNNENYRMFLKRKQLLRQELNKKWMVRSKSRKTQFSKINVSVKKISHQPPCHSKYVYKNKDIILKRQLTKAAVLKRRGSFVQTGLSLDKTKYIKTKYNLIRKYHSYYSNSSALKGNKIKPTSRTKLESGLKMKLRIQNSSCKKHFKRKGLSIVNIGGEFYRCSRTSLTRNKPRPKQALQKNVDGTVLHIHGQKFKLERNGLTLTCLEKNPRRKRVDIGGVTFISSSSGNSLTRTNYHTARSILVHAKQKSISWLTRKLKKNNEPCLFFHRFGKCSGKERGTCVRQHDPKNVAVCKKFVQGSCSDAQCALSHTVSCHNMPTCRHFLAGHCSRDNCLYPHIKVSDSASICLDFLRGYCQLGGQCTKRHRDICPSFEKGVCPRGKYCPYPHPKAKSGKSLSRLTMLRKPKPPPRDAEVVSSSNLRYFDDVNLLKENKREPEECHNQPEEEFISGEKEDGKLFRNRPKLGRLPSFIPFTDNDFCS